MWKINAAAEVFLPVQKVMHKGTGLYHLQLKKEQLETACYRAVSGSLVTMMRQPPGGTLSSTLPQGFILSIDILMGPT